MALPDPGFLCAVLLVGSLVLRLLLSDPQGRTHPAPSSPCHRSAKLPSSALRIFFSCGIFQAAEVMHSQGSGAQPSP